MHFPSKGVVLRSSLLSRWRRSQKGGVAAAGSDRYCLGSSGWLWGSRWGWPSGHTASTYTCLRRATTSVARFRRRFSRPVAGFRRRPLCPRGMTRRTMTMTTTLCWRWRRVRRSTRRSKRSSEARLPQPLCSPLSRQRWRGRGAWAARCRRTSSRPSHVRVCVCIPVRVFLSFSPLFLSSSH